MTRPPLDSLFWQEVYSWVGTVPKDFEHSAITADEQPPSLGALTWLEVVSRIHPSSIAAVVPCVRACAACWTC